MLPWPFATNCFDYASPKSKFNSREYCYLDAMRKLELNYCKVNKYWTLESNNEKNITQCFKPNFIILNKICKVNCIDIKIEYEMRKFDLKVTYLFFDAFDIMVLNRNQIVQRLYLQYTPKFTKT